MAKKTEPCKEHDDEFGRPNLQGYGDCAWCVRDQRDELVEAGKRMLTLVDSLMPGIKHIALQDYAIVNDAPMEMRKAIDKANDQENKRN